MRQAVLGGRLGELGVREKGDDATRWHLPGVLWGGLQLAEGDLVHDKTWADSELPGRLADPAAWLPASAWADARIGAYVPARYAICGWSKDRPAGPWPGLELLPAAAREAAKAVATELDPADPYGPGAECRYEVTPEGARSVAARLDEAGVPRELGEHSVGYWVDGIGALWLLPVLPDGSSVCECG